MKESWFKTSLSEKPILVKSLRSLLSSSWYVHIAGRWHWMLLGHNYEHWWSPPMSTEQAVHRFLPLVSQLSNPGTSLSYSLRIVATLCFSFALRMGIWRPLHIDLMTEPPSIPDSFHCFGGESEALKSEDRNNNSYLSPGLVCARSFYSYFW